MTVRVTDSASEEKKKTQENQAAAAQMYNDQFVKKFAEQNYDKTLAEKLQWVYNDLTGRAESEPNPGALAHTVCEAIRTHYDNRQVCARSEHELHSVTVRQLTDMPPAQQIPWHLAMASKQIGWLQDLLTWTANAQVVTEFRNTAQHFHKIRGAQRKAQEWDSLTRTAEWSLRENREMSEAIPPDMDGVERALTYDTPDKTGSSPVWSTPASVSRPEVFTFTSGGSSHATFTGPAPALRMSNETKQRLPITLAHSVAHLTKFPMLMTYTTSQDTSLLKEARVLATAAYEWKTDLWLSNWSSETEGGVARLKSLHLEKLTNVYCDTNLQIKRGILQWLKDFDLYVEVMAQLNGLFRMRMAKDKEDTLHSIGMSNMIDSLAQITENMTHSNDLLSDAVVSFANEYNARSEAGNTYFFVAQESDVLLRNTKATTALAQLLPKGAKTRWATAHHGKIGCLALLLVEVFAYDHSFDSEYSSRMALENTLKRKCPKELNDDLLAWKDQFERIEKQYR